MIPIKKIKIFICQNNFLWKIIPRMYLSHSNQMHLDKLQKFAWGKKYTRTYT